MKKLLGWLLLGALAAQAAPRFPSAVAIGASANRIAVATADGRLQLLDWKGKASGTPWRSRLAQPRGGQLNFSSDGRWLASSLWNVEKSVTTLYDVPAVRALRTFSSGGSEVDATGLLVGEGSFTSRLLSLPGLKGGLLFGSPDDDQNVGGGRLASALTSRYVALAGTRYNLAAPGLPGDGYVHLYDRASGKKIGEDTLAISVIGVDLAGERVLALTREHPDSPISNQLCLGTAQAGTLGCQPLPNPGNLALHGGVFIRGGNGVVAAIPNGLRFWSTNPPAFLSDLPIEGGVTDLAVHPNGVEIAVLSGRGELLTRTAP